MAVILRRLRQGGLLQIWGHPRQNVSTNKQKQKRNKNGGRGLYRVITIKCKSPNGWAKATQLNKQLLLIALLAITKVLTIIVQVEIPGNVMDISFVFCLDQYLNHLYNELGTYFKNLSLQEGPGEWLEWRW